MRSSRETGAKASATITVKGESIGPDALNCAGFTAPDGKESWEIPLELRGARGALSGSGSYIVHRAKGGLFVLPHIDPSDGPVYAGTCPAHTAAFEVRREGDLVVTEATGDAMSDESCPNTPPDCRCTVDGTSVTTSYYDIPTGTKLLEVRQVVGSGSARAALSVIGEKPTLRGPPRCGPCQGCPWKRREDPRRG